MDPKLAAAIGTAVAAVAGGTAFALTRPKPDTSLTQEDISTLLTVFDTVLPAVDPVSLSAPASVSADAVNAFAAEKPSDLPVAELTGALAALPAHQVLELKKALAALRASGPTALLMNGTTTPFVNLPLEKRQAVFLSWERRRCPDLRRLHHALTRLAVAQYLGHSRTAARAMGYNPPATPPGQVYPYKFASDHELRTATPDVIIVGSGAGGGVVAKELAEAGLSVLVIESGEHFPPNGLVLTDAQARALMFEGAGMATSAGGDLLLLAGKVFGGGTTVNLAASIEPPRIIREDWARTSGVDYFTSEQYQVDLDAVSSYMGVSLAPSHNYANTLVLTGAKKLGYAAAPVPQNNGGAEHLCGHDCANGCRSGGKKGGVWSWLAGAAAAGATFATGYKVTRVILENGRAVGVVVTSPLNGEMTIKAPRVVLSAGAVHSPALLLRSGIRSPHIGKLHTHPTNYVIGVFPQPTYPTDGTILTSVVNEFAVLNPTGHGVRLEVGLMQPSFVLPLLPAEGIKARVLQHAHMVGLLVFVRDSVPGKVTLGADGPVVTWRANAHDKGYFLKGALAAAEILKAMGAHEVIVAGAGVWRAGDDWDAWKRKLAAPETYGSAHQMGSVRIGATPRLGAAAPTGAVYGAQGLWAADASLFPSASGVNPMLGVMALARNVARDVVRDAKDGKGAAAAERQDEVKPESVDKDKGEERDGERSSQATSYVDVRGEA
ncbi:hypothetical protein VHUM_01944 [Vanrija humicola]|uniref:Long-chain-alcohol oxidase n=1 Tax=Vanrija humicola TaxID=5417 RepID=A0A7D8V2R2_VANHU|nr:hypothetical protein VHUM_01944 [Vanrija humicola]